MARRKQTVVGVMTTPPKFGDGLSARDIPNLQRYDAAANQYDPDYRLTPLTIDINISITDPDEPLSLIDGRDHLTNVQWYEIGADGSRTPIVIDGGSSTPGYGAADAWSLQVMKNAAPGEPIRLLMKGVVVYKSDRFEIERTINVSCEDSTPSVRCQFDLPGVMPYNPIHDGADLTVRLIVYENNTPAVKGHYIPVWETQRDNGGWTEYGLPASDPDYEPTDYWMDVAADKCSAVIHQDLMAEGVKIRVRLKYSREGNPGAVTLADGDLSMAHCSLEVVRDLGGWRYRVLDIPDSIRGFKEIRARMVFSDGKGDIADAEKYFTNRWYAGPASRNLTESDAIGDGMTALIAVSKAGNSELAIETDPKEREPLKAWADSDGTVITDADGSIILI